MNKQDKLTKLIECLCCATKFGKKPKDSYKQWAKRKFCSNKCSGKYNSNRGTGHRLWKGDEVSYSALHHWLRREYGHPKTCEMCGIVPIGNTKDGRSKMHWANVSGEYKRERSDWMALCTRCHFHNDFLVKNLVSRAKGGHYVKRG